MRPSPSFHGVRTPRTEAASTLLAGVRVLVVEDRAELRDLFVALLTADGAEAANAGTAREALELCATRRFDAVLCDLGLPDLPGDVLIRQLVTGSTAPPLIVVITGHGEPHLGRASAAGAQAVFRKPVEWDRILACLRRVKLSRPAC